MKKIWSEILDFFDFVINENSPRFKAEVILFFMLISVIFMTCLNMAWYNKEKAASSLVIENIEIPEVKPYTLRQIQYNITQLERKNGEIKYIVIHDTYNTREGADAQNHYNYFNSGNQKASADFFVDSNEIIQTNDYYNYYSWHCGDGGKSAKINNRNSIGVEICINSDGDYKEALEKTIVLVRILMKELNLGIDAVVRHHDASGKDCPYTMNTLDWMYFKDRIVGRKTDNNYVMSYLR